jgi:hypothetical protein
MMPDRSEHRCHTIDMSPGGVLLSAMVSPYRGQRIIAYLLDIGRIEGLVTRVLRDRFAISLVSSLRKKETTASSLTWLGNHEDLGLPENRRSERILLARPAVTLQLANGRILAGQVLDISMNGAALATAAALPTGQALTLGARPAQVIRSFNGGCAVQFLVPISADDLHSNMML